MKMLKKMAALLLAGVMAMALLTACGDEAPAKSTAEQAEDAMTIAINQSMGTDFKNDETLKNLARKAIADRVEEDGKFKDGFMIVDQENKVMCVIFPADRSTALGFTADQVAQMKDPAFTKAFVESFRNASNMDDDDVKKINAIGVGAVTKGDKTYIAIAVKVKTAK